MSANIAVIYSADSLRGVAEAIGDAARALSANVRLRRVAEPGAHGTGPGDEDSPPIATAEDLEWADGIAFGTPIGDGTPSPALMGFIASTEAVWSMGSLCNAVVSTFTDEPEHFAPDSVEHPIYEALYHWGAVIVGPRSYELELDARPQAGDRELAGGLSGPRLRTARYRGRRLTALAVTLAAERKRRTRLEL